MMSVRKATAEEIKQSASWDEWSKEPSEFPWYYDDRETCYIMEGQATVTDNKGNSISFVSGDWVVFEKGLSCTWKIAKTIKKKYYFG